MLFIIQIQVQHVLGWSTLKLKLPLTSLKCGGLNIKREDNVVAHTLAKNALGVADMIADIEEVPICFQSLL